MSPTNTIKCPNCGVEIDIDEIFYHQIEEQYRQKNLAEQKKLRDEIEAKRKEYKEHLEALKLKEEELEAQKVRFERELSKATEEKVEERLRIEKQKLQKNLEAKIAAEREAQIKELTDELSAKTEQVKALHAATAEIERLKREKEELAAKARAEAELALSKQLAEEKAKLQKTIEDEIALKLKAKDEQIEQMRRDIESAKRKAEQGSMQVQGEALELSIEEWLQSQFPFDTVEEVKKGAFGADCIQTVHTRDLLNCGVIAYESKNTKSWSNDWIPKLKKDMLSTNADIGVLVSSVYPPGMERMGWVDGIWVCSLEEFKGSASLLRESLIRIHKATLREENKGDKMTLLYNYLTGNEFQMQLRAIVDGFMQMQSELDKERRSLMAAWKRRQKLIDGVLQNTTEMYGSLQGIAGAGALGHIEALELPGEIED